MSEATQKYREIAIKTVLDDDELLLTAISGNEEISTLYQYHLEMYSTNDSIDPNKVVGQPATIRIDAGEDETRYFHGIISDFSHSGWGTEFVNYRATLVPKLWLLDQTSDCRIFEEKSVKQIVAEILDQYKIKDVSWKLNSPLPNLEYCVQYRETDFNFISRLLEEEGIFYFFKHENNKHTLILSDNPSSYLTIPDKDVEFLDPKHNDPTLNRVLSWQRTYTLRSGAFAHTDYNFKTPEKRLVKERSKKHMKFNGIDQLEIYDYHGRHMDGDRGAALAKIRMEEIEAQHDVAKGDSTCRTFTPGAKFKFKDHRSESEIGNSYVLTRVHTSARLDTYLGNSAYSFRNSFECIPVKVPYRPQRKTRKPVVEGPQTAIIVGPEGEIAPKGKGKDKEIYVDEHARVKVRFHWIRDGKNHGRNSSCWMRVSQAWAGNGYGGMSIPRIGHEVIVDFLEGDPDHPIISGRVYNAKSMPNSSNAGRKGNTPPKDIPAAAMMTSFKSNSVGSSGSNEITMNDEGGKEGLFFKAQKDEIHDVGNDRTDTVGHDEKRKVGNDRSREVVNNEDVTVGKNQSIDVGVDKTVTVGKNHSETVGVDQTVKVGKNQTTTVGMNQSTTVMLQQSLKVGVSASEMVGVSKSVMVGGRSSLTVGAAMSTTVMGNISESTKSSSSEDVSKKKTLKVGEEFSIVCGSAKFVMKKDGTILLEGKDITIKASGKITAKASGDVVIKGSKIGKN